MKYLNGPSTLNQSESMLRATQEQKGVWFDLWCYCHQQMNSGMIVGCSVWTDTMWQRIAGTTSAFILLDSPLWHFSNSSILVIHHYDAVAEEAYKRRQMLGKRYAERRWQAEREQKIIRISSRNNGNSQKDNAS